MKDNILDRVFHAMNNSYKQQEELYLNMLELINKQKEFILEEKFDELSEVIEQRQELIDELEVINQAIQPVKKEVCSVLGIEEFSTVKIMLQVQTEGVKLLHHTLNQLGNILIKIREQDVENEKLLSEKIQQVKGQLNKIQSGKQAVKAYTNNITCNNSAFFNKSR